MIILAIRQYVECKPCDRERKDWMEKLRADKNFMHWHGFRRYSPAEERDTPQGAVRKATRDKERVS